MRYEFGFLVIGKNHRDILPPFPLVMLSYDKCFPTSQKDAEVILATYFHRVTRIPEGDDRWSHAISLSAVTGDPSWMPTIGKWNELGWSVGTIRRRPV